MANTSTFSKMSKTKQKALVEDAIGEGSTKKTCRDLAGQYGTSKSTISRIIKNEIPDVVAKADADRTQAIIDTYVGRLEKKILYCETMADSVDEELRQGRTDGKYDLSDVGRALAMSRMMHDAIKSLREVVMDILKIQGNIRESNEIRYNPTLILQQIVQLVQVSDSKEDMIARLKQLKCADPISD